MRILLLHPRPDTLSGYYGLRATAELLSHPAVTPLDEPAFQADIQVHADWDTIPENYDLVHVSLRLLDYESDLLARVTQAVQAGVRVLVDLDAPLSGTSRLAQLRRQLCQAASAVRVYSLPAFALVRLTLGDASAGRILVCPAYVPPIPQRVRPSREGTPVIGVYPTDESPALTYLRDTAAYLRGQGGAGVRWTLLGGVGYELDQQAVRVVPVPDFSQRLRQAGEKGLQLALRLYNQRHESLADLLRRVPAGVPIPPFPFVTVRQDQEINPANQTYQALAGGPTKPIGGSTTKPSPQLQLTQLRELDALVIPATAPELNGEHQLLAGICAQLGVHYFRATPANTFAKPKQLARALTGLAGDHLVAELAEPVDQARSAQQVQALYKQVLGV